MKKLLGVCLAFILIISMAGTSFAQSDDPIGKWTCVSYTVSGYTYEASGMFQKGCSVELRADGTGRIVMEDYVEESVKWADTGDAILLSGSYIFNEAKMAQGLLTIDYHGVLLTFERESTEPQTPNAIADHATANDGFIGMWVGKTMEMEGEQIDIAMLGMSMTITLNADGTYTQDTNGEASTGTWTQTSETTGELLSGGAAILLTLQDGNMLMEQDGMKMLFVPGGESAPGQSGAPVVNEDHPVLGQWFKSSYTYQGWLVSTIEELAATGEYVIFNADGTGVYGASDNQIPAEWTLDGDVFTFTTMIGEDHFSLSEDNTRLVIVNNPNAEGYYSREKPDPNSIPDGTGENTGFIGHWTLAKVDQDGARNDPEEGTVYLITMRDDGMCVINNNGVLSACTWASEDGAVGQIVRGEYASPIELKDGALFITEYDRTLILISGHNADALLLPGEGAAIVPDTHPLLGEWIHISQIEPNRQDLTTKYEYRKFFADGTVVFGEYGQYNSETFGTWVENAMVYTCECGGRAEQYEIANGRLIPTGGDSEKDYYIRDVSSAYEISFTPDETMAMLYCIFLGLVLASVLLFIVGRLVTRQFARILKLPTPFLQTLVILLGMVGAFALHNSYYDIVAMFIFSIIGYFFDRFKFSNSAMILGLILGQLAENNLRKQIIIGNGSALGLITRPVALVCMLAAIYMFISPFLKKYFSKKKAEKQAAS